MRPSTERTLINKHVRQHNRDVGEHIYWFEFRPFAGAASAGSLYDDLFDEGAPGTGGRDFLPGKKVSTIYVVEDEDLFTLQDDGRQPTQNISVTIQYIDMVAAGITNPREYREHLNDMLLYDGRYYKIHDYHVRGRLPDEVVIGVRGFEVFLDQELVWDPGPTLDTIVDSVWPDTFPTLGV